MDRSAQACGRSRAAGPPTSARLASSLGLLTGAAVTMLGQRASSQSAFAGPGLAPWAGATAVSSSRASPGSPPSGAPGSLGSPATAPRASVPRATGLALASSALAFAGALWARSARPALRRRPRVRHCAQGDGKDEQPELKSELGLDYKDLRDLLQAHDFKAADAQTRRLIIKMAGEAAEKRGWAFFHEIRGIPNSDMETMNALWGHFSDGRFGFTPQRRIWRKNREQFDKFAEEVSWFTGRWKNRNWPDEFIYDLQAPIGHLPLTNCIRGAQVLAELLSHPAFEKKKASTSTSSRPSPVSMLALQEGRRPIGRREPWVGSSRPTLSAASPLSGLPKAAAGSAAADDLAASVRLGNLEEHNVINEGGLILPLMPSETQACAFLVYDSTHKPQYLGFSKDLRNTLRTLVCRRPELCYYYRFVPFAEADEASMLEVRSTWVDELGALPLGNSDARQKSYWEEPVDGGAMSERAYKVVAEQKVKQVQQQLKDRGLKEPLEFSTDLIAQGKVDVLPSKLSLDVLMAEQENMSANTKKVAREFEGKPIEFDIFYASEFRTNGGWWLDVEVYAQKQKSTHRIIVGDDFMTAVGTDGPREVVENAFVMLIARKAARKTEGLISSEIFPINYFTATNLASNYPEFLSLFGTDPEKFDWDVFQWSFKQVHDYAEDEGRTISAGPTK